MALTEVNYDKYAKLFQCVVDAGGYPKNIIDIFNHCMLKRVPQRIQDNIIEYPNGVIVRYENVRTQLRQDNKIKIPWDVLQNNESTYLFDYIADISMEINGVKTYLNGARLCSQPNMLGSKICVLNSIPLEERIRYNECPSDSLGYFRVRGTEKILTIQEKLRNSQLFIFSKDADIDCRITLPCKNGTLVTILKVITETQSFRIQLGYEYSNMPIPIYGIYDFLGKNTDYATAMILRFIEPENQAEAEQILLPSIQEYLTIEKNVTEDKGDNVLRRENRERMLDWIKFYRVKYELKNLNDEEIIIDILNRLFPNIPVNYTEDINIEEYKLLQLSWIVSQLIKYLLGLRPLDDRDSWANKRLDSAGRQMEQLFNIMWDTHLNELREKGNATPALVSYTSPDIERDMISAFNPGAWGIKKSKKKENYVDIMKRDTALAVKQQITKINTPTSRHDPTTSVRSVQPSQYGKVDPHESPEGDVIGLVKNMAITCHISLEHSPENVKEILLRNEEFIPLRSSDLLDIPPVVYPVLLDGIIRGWVKKENAIILRRNLVAYRRRGEIESDVCIFLDEEYGQLEIYCNSSRPTHPVLVVNEEKQILEIENKNIDLISLMEKRVGETDQQNAERVLKYLVSNGCIEFLDAKEQEFCYLAENPRNFKLQQKRKMEILSEIERTDNEEIKTSLRNEYSDIPNYTHCSIDSMDIFSIMCCLAPKANHQQGPRTSYQAGMIRQSLGMYHSVHWRRFDTGYKILLHVCRPLFDVQTAKFAQLDQMPASINNVVAYMALPANQEDGTILNEDALQKYQLYKYFTNKIVIVNNPGGNESEEIRMPEVLASQKKRYHAIDPNTGLPIVGKHVRDRDFILGRIRKVGNEIKNASISISYTEEGIIDRVSVENSGSNKQIVKIKIRVFRTYIEGDKMAARYSQKGVCSQIRKAKDLPCILGGPNHGIVPCLFINPHGIPSRMTLGMLMEFLSSKAAVYLGRRINGTTFSALLNNVDIDDMTQIKSVPEEIQDDIETLRAVLKRKGMLDSGYEFMMYNDGRLVQSLINVGICTYAALRHHVLDKFQARGSEGAIHVQSHQPVGGRSQGGGIRFGEMEQNSQVSHGASDTLRDCLCLSSDVYKMVFCAKCGIPPTYKVAVGDQLPAYQCKRCGLNNFCTVEISFTCKYLMQLLNGMGIEIAFDLQEISEREKLLI